MKSIGIKVDEKVGGYSLYLDRASFKRDWPVLQELPLRDNVCLVGPISWTRHQKRFQKLGVIAHSTLRTGKREEVSSLPIGELGKFVDEKEIYWLDCAMIPTDVQIDHLFQDGGYEEIGMDGTESLLRFLSECQGTMVYSYDDDRQVFVVLRDRSIMKKLISHNFNAVLDEADPEGQHELGHGGMDSLIYEAGDYLHIYSQDVTRSGDTIQFKCWRSMPTRDRKTKFCAATLRNGTLEFSPWSDCIAPKHVCHGLIGRFGCTVLVLIGVSAMYGLGYGIYKLIQLLF